MDHNELLFNQRENELYGLVHAVFSPIVENYRFKYYTGFLWWRKEHYRPARLERRIISPSRIHVEIKFEEYTSDYGSGFVCYSMAFDKSELETMLSNPEFCINRLSELYITGKKYRVQ